MNNMLNNLLFCMCILWWYIHMSNNALLWMCTNICRPIEVSWVGLNQCMLRLYVLCLFQPKTLSCMAYSVQEFHCKVQASISCTLCSQGLWDFRLLSQPSSSQSQRYCTLQSWEWGQQCGHHYYAPPSQVVGGGLWGFEQGNYFPSTGAVSSVILGLHKCAHVQ